MWLGFWLFSKINSRIESPHSATSPSLIVNNTRLGDLLHSDWLNEVLHMLLLSSSSHILNTQNNSDWDIDVIDNEKKWLTHRHKSAAHVSVTSRALRHVSTLPLFTLLLISAHHTSISKFISPSHRHVVEPLLGRECWRVEVSIDDFRFE